MRNSLIFLFLASAVMPAVAADNDSDREARHAARAEARSEHHAERSESTSERQAEQAQPSERSEHHPQVRSLEVRHDDRPVVVHQPQIEPGEGRGFEHRSGPSLAVEPQHPVMERHRDTTDSVREWRGRTRRVDSNTPAIEPHNGTLGNGSFRELRREPAGRDSIGNRRGPVIGSIPRPGAQPPLPTTTRQSRTRLSSVTAQHWRNNWRSDHRYDWHNHRHHHRSLFHLGFYYDPFGWGYQRYSIGSRLWPSYYRSSFWLNDPWQYRLPYAPPGYRWIRYYDDAILIDTWDGQVVDVIYNFFW
jgi:Ni/Co efflux regulator RcnB